MSLSPVSIVQNINDMYKILILSIGFLLISSNAIAQEVKLPLADKEVIEEEIPTSPGENYTWVEAHWEFVYVNYEWMEGHYIETKEKHTWVKAEWERNQKTGWFTMDPGYWQQNEADLTFKGGEETNTVSGFTIENSSPFKNVYANLK